jgi:hypothetical protein
MLTQFPGFVIRRNSSLSNAVRAIQERLIAVGCGPVEADGLFGPETEAAVRLFQTRFPDVEGRALRVDGEVGPVTWAAMFGGESLSPVAQGGALAQAALKHAGEQVGVSEEPPGSNRGKKVEEFLSAVGVAPGNPWCAAFVYWCVDHAAGELNVANKLPRTGGVLELWRRAKRDGLPCVPAAQVAIQPSLVSAGMIFIIDHGHGKGHTGFVEGQENGRLVTVEGNSSDGGSREGTGVFRLKRRTVATINTGFIGVP